MFKKIRKILKRVLVSIFLVYSFNLIASSLQIIIPLNFYTIGTITILGAPSLLAFVVILLIAY